MFVCIGIQGIGEGQDAAERRPMRKEERTLV
jgi:hypothetical protein